MFRKVIEKRDCGLLRIQSISKWYNDIAPAIHELGFSCKPEQLIKIDKELAKAIVTNILWRDLAHDSEIMSLAEAQIFASELILEFSDDNTCFYTNGNWQSFNARMALKSWAPFSNATFDSGVIFMNKESGFCIWVEDED